MNGTNNSLNTNTVTDRLFEEEISLDIKEEKEVIKPSTSKKLLFYECDGDYSCFDLDSFNS